MPISYITHKGKKITYVDYSTCKTPAEMLAQLEEIAEVYRKSEESILILNNFTGNFGSDEFIKRAKELGPTVFDQKTEKSAVLGISGIKKILLQAYNKFIKHKMVPFDTRSEALDYLAS